MCSTACSTQSEPSMLSSEHSTVQSSEKPDAKIKTEKHVHLNTNNKNHMSNGVSSKRTKKSKMYRRCFIKIPNGFGEYDIDFQEIFRLLGEGILDYYKNLNNPENLKTIFKYYERSFWGNECLVYIY